MSKSYRYVIRVKTADEDGAGTNSDIYLNMNNLDSYNSSRGIYLDSSADDHERGSTFITERVISEDFDLLPSSLLPTEIKLDIYKYDDDRPEWKPSYVEISARVEERTRGGAGFGGWKTRRFPINRKVLFGTLKVNESGVVSWNPR